MYNVFLIYQPNQHIRTCQKGQRSEHFIKKLILLMSLEVTNLECQLLPKYRRLKTATGEIARTKGSLQFHFRLAPLGIEEKIVIVH
jgi:hypothetical protein